MESRQISFFFRIAFFPLVIGEHVFIGEGAVVSAASVGSYVYIGKNAIIVSPFRKPILSTNLIEYFVFNCTQGRRCVIKDCCIIEDGAVVPPETTVASFMKFTAKGTIEGDQGNPNFVPASMQDLMVDFTKSYYENFTPVRAKPETN